MNVWIKACRKQATCKWCRKPIENKTYMVVTQHYRGKWKIRRNWHPDCWIEQGIVALEKKVFVENRGRIKLSLTDEQRKKRFKIMARRASVLQRIKKEVDTGNIENMIHLGMMLNKLKDEIEPYGGVPKTW